MQLLTIPQAAEYLELSPVRVRQFCQAGRLGQKIGGRWLVTKDELDEFSKQPRPQGYPKGKPRQND